MTGTIILIFTLLLYKIFTYKSSADFKLCLFIFTLIFLIYNCFPFLILNLKATNLYDFKNVGLVEVLNLKIVLLIASFYFFFLVGCKLSFFLIRKIGFINNYKINFEKYNFCLKNIVLILFIVILLFYNDLLLYSLESYEANISISNNGLYNYLKYLFLIILSMLLSQEKKIFTLYILFFFFSIIIFSFLTSDKNPLLILFSLTFFIFFRKKNFKNLNLLSISLILNALLYIFLPFFSYFRNFRTFSGFYEWFIQQNYSFLGDAGAVLLSIILIAENNVNLEINFFHNLISFLPRYVRELFNYQDLAVEFAKIVLKENYVGQGYGFSIVAESYLYLKKDLFGFIFFVVFLGFVYIFFIQIISKKLVPHKLSFYIITVMSVLSSLSATRNSSAGLFLFSFRFLILFLILYIIYILFKNFLSIKYRI
jgi:hypothetical protein